MNTKLRHQIRFLVQSLTFAFLITTGSAAQVAKPVISLEKQDVSAIPTANLPESEKAHLAHLPANFHHFGSATVGELANAEALKVRFEATTRITGLRSTRDFKIEQGSSCVEGNVYSANTTCTLLVRFTPQGAGHRVGRLLLSHSGASAPIAFGLSGYSYVPVVSFTPAVITTVPGSYTSPNGLLVGARNLTVDGGDTLYVADTGNNVIRMLDSSGVFSTISSGSLSAPLGVAADSFGEVFFSEPAANLMYEIFAYGSQVTISGSGTDSCTYAAPCKITSEKLFNPGQMSMDPYDQLFFADGSAGAAFSKVEPYPPTLARIYNPFTYQESFPDAFAVDSGDTMYSFWQSSVCALVTQSFSNAVNSSGIYTKVAGGRICGFSGDGGPARNAEIGTVVGQISFDLAGNLYFSDSQNQRVRRIDASTGMISTIAGTGTAGYSGDNGAATSATLSTPLGVTVDSQGQVYITSGNSATPTSQVIRKVGPNGLLAFGNQLKGSTSSTKIVTVSNTGNTGLLINKAVLTGGTAGDFAIDPNATSCYFGTGTYLNAGQSCKVGVIFKPIASGARTTNLNLLDNSVNSVNTVVLTGTGTLPPATVTITAPASGASVAAGTTVPFTVTVTSSTTPAPTGTVKFSVDGSTVAAAVAISAGSATVNLTGLTVATHSLAATYSGDSNYALTGPVTRTLVVTAASKVASVVSLTAPASTTTTCSSLTFTSTVAAKAKGTPTGTVQLMEGKSILAKASLVSGHVTLTAPPMKAGTHRITAQYLGDTQHIAATSGTVQQIVRQQASCTHLSAGPVPVLGMPPGR